jgi:1,4-dihydroxy-6-naphthoate synthase
MTKVAVAFSPCPNDTFLFHAWVQRLVPSALEISPVFGDIEQLNEWALEGRYPVTKISTACLPQVTHLYRLLPVGSALGFNCGPKIIAKTPFSLSELSSKRVAVPGKHTTAHCLLNLFAPSPHKKHFCLFHETADLIDNGAVDAGVIIHEQRFTFKQKGFVEIADLGELWHQHTALPLPLGSIVVRKDVGDDAFEEISHSLKSSLEYAWNHPHASEHYVSMHSQEKDLVVIKKHIQTYVNAETLQLSAQGYEAIQQLIPIAGVSTSTSLAKFLLIPAA